MKLLLDNNLSFRLAEALHALTEVDGHTVAHLSARFPADTPDLMWIEALGAEGGWVVLSEDRRIQRNAAERAAWRRARLIAFFLAPAWHHRSNLDKAWRLIRAWPRLVEASRLVTPPAAFEVPIKGNRLRQL